MSQLVGGLLGGRSRSGTTGTYLEPPPGEKTQRGVKIISSILLVGMFIISVLMARGAPADTNGIGVGVVTFLLFVAAAAVGAALGFLFGLPRARFADQLNAASANAGEVGATSPAATAVSSHFLTNSNLTKVSDWLTTIVIGLGLVNLGRVIPALREFAAALEDPLGGYAYAGAIGISVLVAGTVASFLLVYLWTSIRFRELLEDSEKRFEPNVPNVVGMRVSEAKRLLGTTSLELVPPAGASDDAQIAWQSIDPGSTVPRGSEFTVSVNEDGPDQAEIPSVVGKTVREAVGILARSELRLRRDGAVDDAQITTQSPDAGTKASKGTELTITTAS